MNELEKLRAERAALVAKLNRRADEAVDENGEPREMSEEEQKKFDENEEEIRALDAKISTAERRQIAKDRAAALKESEKRTAPPMEPKKERGFAPDPVIESVVRNRSAERVFGPGPDGQRASFMAGLWVRGMVDAAQGHAAGSDYCRRAGEMGLRYERDMSSNHRALTPSLNSAGGYLIPEVLMTGIINLKEAYGVFRRNCQTVPMVSDTIMWPRRATGNTHYWVGPNTEITSSDQSFGNIALVAKMGAMLQRVPVSLMEDALIDLGSFIAEEFAHGFSLAEDNAGFLGDGSSTYGGIQGLPKLHGNAGTIYTALTGNTAFSTLDDADFIGALGLLPEYAVADGNVAWFFSRAGAYASMIRLMREAGGVTQETRAGVPVMTYLGYPIVISQVLNSTLTAQTSTVIGYVGNLRMAAKLGDRRTFTMQPLFERYAEYNQIGFIGTQRIDINVHEAGTATAAGPMVAIKTPGS